jgi:hypothetical protein
VSGFEIAAAVVLALGILVVVYSVVRLAWRLRQGDVESAGSDGDSFRR